jgi:hypothetical protein
MSSATGPETHPRSSFRVLRWTFTRGDETLTCELMLTRDESAYELSIRPAWNPTAARREVFDDALAALQRHASIERTLVGEGWGLAQYESDSVER